MWRNLCALILFGFSLQAYGGEGRKSPGMTLGDAIEAYDQFLVTVRVFNEYETLNGVAEGRVRLPDFFMSSAYAQYNFVPILSPSPSPAASNSSSGQQAQGDQKICLIAGNVGRLVNGKCKLKNGASVVSRDGKSITCGIGVFGSDVVIPRPRDSRWTVACANEVLKRAGVNPQRTIDDQLDQGEILNIANYLKAKTNMITMKEIFNQGACDQVADRGKDRQDCKRIRDVFLNQVNQTNQVRTKTYRECWKQWTTPGATLVAKGDLKVGDQIDSLILVSALGGCDLEPGQQTKAEKNCRIKSGATIKMTGLQNRDNSKVLIKADVECEMPNGIPPVTLKEQDFLIDCDHGGISDVPFRMSRMMKRNFTLSPECNCDLRTEAEKFDEKRYPNQGNNNTLYSPEAK